MTEKLQDMLADRLTGYLALLAHHRSGGPGLVPGSQEFGERARRLQTLRVVRVPRLSILARLAGTEEQVSLSGGDVVHLDQSVRGRPLVLASARASDIAEALRPRLAPVLAALVDNAAIQDTFALYLQRDDDEYVESFLLERGIGPSELQDIERHLKMLDAEEGQVEARWWRSLLRLLGHDGDPPTRRDEALRWIAAEPVRGTPSLLDAIRRSGGGREARHDGSPGSALYTLEAVGHDLARLDALLRAVGDEGLFLDVAGERLRRFRHDHGRMVAFVLAERTDSAMRAKETIAAWRASEDLSLRANPAPHEWLAPVVRSLADVGISADAAMLAGGQAAAYLAALIGATEAEIQGRARALYSEEEVRRQLRDAATAWRHAVHVALVAACCRPTDADYRLLEEDERIGGELPEGVAEPADLAAPLLAFSGRAASLTEALLAALPAAGVAQRPNRDELSACVRQHLSDPAFLDRVWAVLERKPKKRVVELRRRMTQLEEAHLALAPYAGSTAAPPHQHAIGPRKTVAVSKVRNQQRHLDRLGTEAETWVLASVLAPLLALPDDARAQAIEQMKEAVNSHYQGNGAERVLRRADEALALPAGSDELVDALSGFLHLSATSDMFGCDILGYLAPYPGAPSQPLFVEVKSDRDRRFQVSAAEWRQAEKLGPEFAFLVVLRSETGVPAAMELLPDPVGLKASAGLVLEEDGWIVSYRPVT